MVSNCLIKILNEAGNLSRLVRDAQNCIPRAEFWAPVETRRQTLVTERPKLASIHTRIHNDIIRNLRIFFLAVFSLGQRPLLMSQHRHHALAGKREIKKIKSALPICQIICLFTAACLALRFIPCSFVSLHLFVLDYPILLCSAFCLHVVSNKVLFLHPQHPVFGCCQMVKQFLAHPNEQMSLVDAILSFYS